MEDKLNQESEEISRNFNNKLQQGTAKVGKQVWKLGGKSIKAVGKGTIKLASHFIVALVHTLLAFLPFILIGFFIIFALSILYNWQLDERGSSGQLSQNPAYENVVDVVNGVQTAVALTEPQAIIDAYYKYMACNSHQKVYIDDSGKEIWLEFNDPDKTSDFAGLVDITQKENYFYLSSYFIKMADELLHNNEFYYPEQIIKPVFAKMLPLENPGEGQSGKKYITALPIVDDGSDNAQALHDHTQAYAVAESLNTSDTETPKRKSPSQNATLDILSQSQAFTKQSHIVTDDNGNGINLEVYKPSGTDANDSGVWDYGFGSILQYEPRTKDKYIDCIFQSFTIHTHELYTYTDEEGEEQTGVRCNGATGDHKITIDSGDTVASLREKISAYESDTCTVAKSPSNDELSKMVDRNANKHLEMLIQPEDKKLSERSFDNASLNTAFGNATSEHSGMYPLKVSVISAAATFSGNIRYEYTDEAISQELQSVESNLSFNSALRDDCTTLVYSFGNTAEPKSATADISPGGESCLSGNLTCVRSGTVWDVHPSSSPTEISVPTGWQYIEDYCSRYKIFVPNTVQSDINFQKRINEEISSYNSEMDYNKDGKITNMDFLLGLGLLRPYAGGTLTAVNGGSGSVVVNENEAMLMSQVDCSGDETLLLAKAISAEAGPNKLDELMCGAVMLNRVNDSRFPNTLIGVLSAGNGSQYASWPDKIKNATPTESEISSAKQLLSGEFAIPSNIVFQKADWLTPEGSTYMTVVNGRGYYTHVYQISKYDNAIAQTDRFGRTALTESQARQLAETLYQADVSSGISTGMPNSGIVGNTGISSDLSTSLQEKDGQKLYAVTGFDILTAITNMHQYQEQVSSGQNTGLLGWFVNAAKSISSTISDFNDYIKTVFSDSWNNNSPSYYVMYNNNVALSDMRDTVLQAITFNEQSTYSDVADSVDPDELVFIFIGKDSGIGLGTNSMGGGWVPGTGSVFEDFSSPTSNYYQTSLPWSETSGSATLAVPEGTIVQAVSDGRITKVEGSGIYTVTMSAKSGDKSIVVKYANLSEVSIASNQNIGKNDKIGIAGNGGLVLSVYIDGRNVNPLEYFYQPVYSSGAAFADILTNGYIDEAKRAALEAAINEANNNITGVVDKWHSSPINTKSVGECTWWAYGRGWQYCEINGTFPPGGFASSYGNGGDYYDRVQQAGHFAVGQTARAGSWVVWSRVTPDSRGKYYGHVAFVEAVDKDGSIWISESARGIWDSHDGTGIALRKIAAPYNYGSGGGFKFKGFVYLDSPL